MRFETALGRGVKTALGSGSLFKLEESKIPRMASLRCIKGTYILVMVTDAHLTCDI
jgi:hypothetical protein